MMKWGFLGFGAQTTAAVVDPERITPQRGTAGGSSVRAAGVRSQSRAAGSRIVAWVGRLQERGSICHPLSRTRWRILGVAGYLRLVPLVV